MPVASIIDDSLDLLALEVFARCPGETAESTSANTQLMQYQAEFDVQSQLRDRKSREDDMYIRNMQGAV